MAKKSKGANVWVGEWAIDFDLLRTRPGKPYSATMPDTAMSINIALGDVDLPTDGDPKMGIRHEQWLCGDHAGRTHLCQFCTLQMMNGKKPRV